jgi:hypothetical protein
MDELRAELDRDGCVAIAVGEYATADAFPSLEDDDVQPVFDELAGSGEPSRAGSDNEDFSSSGRAGHG